MKAILMSIRPQYVAKILNKEKTIEVRKKFPKDYVGWVYIYCTKDRKDLYKHLVPKTFNDDSKIGNVKDLEYRYDIIKDINELYEENEINALNGKVVARFWCDKVDKIHLRFEKYCAGELSQDGLLKYACLTEQELDNYLWSNCCVGYAIHITEVKPFDKPKEISEFYNRLAPSFEHLVMYYEKRGEKYTHDDYDRYCKKAGYKLTRAPRNGWCYVEI